MNAEYVNWQSGHSISDVLPLTGARGKKSDEWRDVSPPMKDSRIYPQELPTVNYQQWTWQFEMTLRNQISNHFSMHIGQAIITPLKTEG